MTMLYLLKVHMNSHETSQCCCLVDRKDYALAHSDQNIITKKNYAKKYTQRKTNQIKNKNKNKYVQNSKKMHQKTIFKISARNMCGCCAVSNYTI